MSKILLEKFTGQSEVVTLDFSVPVAGKEPFSSHSNNNAQLS